MSLCHWGPVVLTGSHRARPAASWPPCPPVTAGTPQRRRVPGTDTSRHTVRLCLTESALPAGLQQPRTCGPATLTCRAVATPTTVTRTATPHGRGCLSPGSRRGAPSPVGVRTANPATARGWLSALVSKDHGQLVRAWGPRLPCCAQTTPLDPGPQARCCCRDQCAGQWPGPTAELGEGSGPRRVAGGSAFAPHTGGHPSRLGVVRPWVRRPEPPFPAPGCPRGLTAISWQQSAGVRGSSAGWGSSADGP